MEETIKRCICFRLSLIEKSMRICEKIYSIGVVDKLANDVLMLNTRNAHKTESGGCLISLWTAAM